MTPAVRVPRGSIKWTRQTALPSLSLSLSLLHHNSDSTCIFLEFILILRMEKPTQKSKNEDSRSWFIRFYLRNEQRNQEMSPLLFRRFASVIFMNAMWYRWWWSRVSVRKRSCYKSPVFGSAHGNERNEATSTGDESSSCCLMELFLQSC